ncbi:hypothetical protein GF1_02980 [Desulfolithobacter dissulfuricans]|uniref:Uncharacterized protein n=1 Tax=Desulfolithobacter dissulfuricans TaxID=2795293 RepID=A0A915U006_9BACT|nr:hypothetical protein [Desulfolithobacter dissulfuricans]BCO07922.1 hypothetical protein GF1_02980 [Desulfolithobacter dissulfuricans]
MKNTIYPGNSKKNRQAWFFVDVFVETVDVKPSSQLFLYWFSENETFRVLPLTLTGSDFSDYLANCARGGQFSVSTTKGIRVLGELLIFIDILRSENKTISKDNYGCI